MSKHILIVDDEDTILHALSRYFMRAGYEVECARELEEAEALLTHVSFDLVIADLALTAQCGTEGLEIIRFARQSRFQPRVILLTANASESLEKEAFRRGCDAYVNKPKPLVELARIAADLTGSAL